jgi:hypothetical protein
MSAFGVFMLLISSVAITAGGMYAVYQMYVKKKLQDDMRNILEEYVPLNSAPDSSSGPSRKFSTSQMAQMVPDFTAVASLAPRLSIGVSTPKVSDGAGGTRFSQSSGQSATPTGTPLSGGNGSSAPNNGSAGSSSSSSTGNDLV